MSTPHSRRDLYIRYVQTGGCGEELYARLLIYLSPADQARAERFHFVKDRLAFALGRALVRTTLSQLGAAPPGGWQYIWNAYGKPDLPPASGMPRYRFNISHCTGLVAAAFTMEREIGLDVEFEARNIDTGIANSYFAHDEVAYIESLPEERRRQEFFRLWTLKEAYIKARGMGLAIPLADFAFTLDPVGIQFPARISDRPENWFFWQTQPTSFHVMAVAAERRCGEEFTVRVQEVAPESLL